MADVPDRLHIALSGSYRVERELGPAGPWRSCRCPRCRSKAGRVDEAGRLIDSAVAASRTVTSPYVRVVRGMVRAHPGGRARARDEAELALALYLWFYLRSQEFRPLASEPRFARVSQEADPRPR